MPCLTQDEIVRENELSEAGKMLTVRPKQKSIVLMQDLASVILKVPELVLNSFKSTLSANKDFLLAGIHLQFCRYDKNIQFWEWSIPSIMKVFASQMAN